jgi:hypothetical protein
MRVYKVAGEVKKAGKDVKVFWKDQKTKEERYFGVLILVVTQPHLGESLLVYEGCTFPIADPAVTPCGDAYSAKLA